MLWLRKSKNNLNSEEYEKINKKIIEIEADIERIELALALYKTQHQKKIREIIEGKQEPEQGKDPYNGVIGY